MKLLVVMRKIHLEEVLSVVLLAMEKFTRIYIECTDFLVTSTAKLIAETQPAAEIAFEWEKGVAVAPVRQLATFQSLKVLTSGC